MTARQLVDWLRAKIPKEKKFPTSPEHEPCERGQFCKTCAQLVAHADARHNLTLLLDLALDELDHQERIEIATLTT